MNKITRFQEVVDRNVFAPSLIFSPICLVFFSFCLGNIYLSCVPWQIKKQDREWYTAQRMTDFVVCFSGFVLQVDRVCSCWLSLSSAEANVSSGAVGVGCLQTCGIICSGAYADCISQLCLCSPEVWELLNRINAFCCIDAFLFFNKSIWQNCPLLKFQIRWTV